MEWKRLALTSALCLGAGLTPQLASAEPGVAFIHGTGAPTDAYNDYWTPGFVDVVVSALPNPNNHVVVNCDFTQFMWDEAAAGCLAGELTEFIDSHGITEMLVVTHSNGANVIRWIMSNPTFDARYPNIISRIKWVDAIAPSSAGTPLADAVIAGNVFENSLGWLLGYQSDGVRQQQEAWMAYYNEYWLYGTQGRPALPKDFWAVVGTEVQSAVWDSDSYCGGYQLTLGLELTQNWLDDCADGFLECTSQAAAGYVWFYDTQYTEGDEPLNHNQSRRPCFGLEQIIRSDV